jgi:mannose-1-phosphate guanylyltransferase/mannose-6-phosphate isomerase
MTKIIPAIMSGGSGTRMWPLSTDAHPKQFHALGAPRSMIEETALRLRGEWPGLTFLDPVIIAGERHRDLVTSTLAASGITPAAVILEPMGRNTAATAALAALAALEMDPEALVLLMPADHLITQPDAFKTAIAAAADIARTHIVTFGIEPTGPETGFGYIRHGEPLADRVMKVAAFKEKPARDVAEAYLREGGYSWNSGIFFFAPGLLLKEFDHAGADIRDAAAAALAKASRNGVHILLDRDAFAACRAEPVDIAVMEQTPRAAVTPCDIGWADVGSWAELWRLSAQDAEGNAVRGSATLLDASNNLIRAEGVHVAVAGVSDLIIVATREGVLVLPRERAQDVKKILPKSPPTG